MNWDWNSYCISHIFSIQPTPGFHPNTPILQFGSSLDFFIKVSYQLIWSNFSFRLSIKALTIIFIVRLVRVEVFKLFSVLVETLLNTNAELSDADPTDSFYHFSMPKFQLIHPDKIGPDLGISNSWLVFGWLLLFYYGVQLSYWLGNLKLPEKNISKGCIGLLDYLYWTYFELVHTCDLLIVILLWVKILNQFIEQHYDSLLRAFEKYWNYTMLQMIVSGYLATNYR